VRRYEAVLFDAGETLLHPSPSFPDLIATFIRERGHDIDAGRVVEAEASLAHSITQMFVEGKHWSTSPERSRAFWTQIYRMLIEKIGIADEGLPGHLYDRFRDPRYYALFDDALPALRTLKERGFRVGVISNFEAWLEGLLASLEVMPFLDALVVSGVEGLEKPDPEIFLRALERIGAPPERAVYVGDSVTFDLEPAQALGMHAFLVDRRGRYDADRYPVVRALTEIPELLS
jgi:putative hydrolase of the HAD superfamily